MSTGRNPVHVFLSTYRPEARNVLWGQRERWERLPLCVAGSHTVQPTTQKPCIYWCLTKSVLFLFFLFLDAMSPIALLQIKLDRAQTSGVSHSATFNLWEM